MISSNFGYGEQSKIASAYASMYAPKQMSESCCKKGGCKKSSQKCESSGLVSKHNPPKKTGSKLGSRKMLPFDKRDNKPSAKKFTPKTKVAESFTKGYCIVDGDSTLCTNDVGESYFNRNGICDNTRIYESKVSAMKDISKVKARRNPNSKYKVRCCECVGESFQFTDYQSEQVNEGFWDGLTNAIGSGIDAVGNTAGGLVKGVGDAAGGLVKGVGNAAGNIPLVGGVVNGVANAAGDAISGVGNTVNNAATGLTGAASGLVNGVGNTIQGGVNSVSDFMSKKDDKNSNAPQQPLDQNKIKMEQDAAMANSGAGMYAGQQPQQQPQPQQSQQPQQVQQQQSNNVAATEVASPNGRAGVEAQKAALDRKASEVQGKQTTIVDPVSGVTTTTPDTNSASVAADNIAKDTGFKDGEEMFNATDKTNNLDDLVRNSTEQQIAAEKGQTVGQMKQQAAANKEVMKNATPEQKNEISKMLRARNNPNNKNMPTMNDIQSKIHSFAKGQNQNTQVPNGTPAKAAPSNGTPAPQTQQQPQQPQQNGQQAGGNKDQQKQQLQQQIAALQKQLAALG